MQIGGFVKTSFVDYPGKIASVVFTQGCNLNCSFCHNTALIKRITNAERKGTELMDAKLLNNEDILSWLSKRKGLIDAVVLSGGEPTIQSGLKAFIEELKYRSFLVKLDTNGTNPDVLETLIKGRLVDFIAMDIKSPLEKYAGVCGMKRIDLQSIQRSVSLIKSSGLDYEFRTTFCGELEDDDILQIVSEFEISLNYVVQNCRSTESIESIRLDRNIGTLAQRLDQISNCSFRGFGTQTGKTKRADVV